MIGTAGPSSIVPHAAQVAYVSALGSTGNIQQNGTKAADTLGGTDAVISCLVPDAALYNKEHARGGARIINSIVIPEIRDKEEEPTMLVNMWTRKFMLRPVAHCRRGCSSMHVGC